MMPFIKKEDYEANERLLNIMAENEVKAKAEAHRWRVFATLILVVHLGLFLAGSF